MKYRANTETRSIALQKYNFLHHGGKGHVSQQAPECVISPHTYYITVEMLAICSSKNVVACRTGLKKSCNLFSEEALRVPGFSILFNEEGNSFPKPLRDAAPAPAVAVPLPKGAVLKGTNREKFPGPFLLLSSLLCFTAVSTKTSSILILALPT